MKYHWDGSQLHGYICPIMSVYVYFNVFTCMSIWILEDQNIRVMYCDVCVFLFMCVCVYLCNKPLLVTRSRASVKKQKDKTIFRTEITPGSRDPFPSHHRTSLPLST